MSSGGQSINPGSPNGVRRHIALSMPAVDPASTRSQTSSSGDQYIGPDGSSPPRRNIVIRAWNAFIGFITRHRATAPAPTPAPAAASPAMFIIEEPQTFSRAPTEPLTADNVGGTPVTEWQSAIRISFSEGEDQTAIIHASSPYDVGGLLYLIEGEGRQTHMPLSTILENIRNGTTFTFADRIGVRPFYNEGLKLHLAYLTPPDNSTPLPDIRTFVHRFREAPAEVVGRVTTDGQPPTIEDVRSKLMEILEVVTGQSSPGPALGRMRRLGEMIGTEAPKFFFTQFFNILEVGVKLGTGGIIEGFVLRFVRNKEATDGNPVNFNNVITLVGTPTESYDGLYWFVFDSEPYMQSAASRMSMEFISDFIKDIFAPFTCLGFFNGALIRSPGQGSPGSPPAGPSGAPPAAAPDSEPVGGSASPFMAGAYQYFAREMSSIPDSEMPCADSQADVQYVSMQPDQSAYSYEIYSYPARTYVPRAAAWTEYRAFAP